MELFADYFTAWLFGLVADKSSRWLVNRVVGDDVERELRRAARAAVAHTARECLPDGLAEADNAAEILIEAIDEAFAAHSPGDLPGPGQGTLLGTLHAGIVARVVAMGEIRLGDGAVIVPASWPAVAQELSTGLVREITLRGARGGPLAPLLAQLNADLTHLQSEQVMRQGELTLAALGQLAATVTQALAHLDGASAGPRAISTLPADVQSFTGRQSEVGRLLQALSQADRAGGVTPVGTVEGMPGAGKTALAVHAAHLLAPHFPDGQFYVGLHGHTPGRRPVRPLFALSALLLATDFPPDRIPSRLDECAAAWRGHMAGRKALLLLDDAASAEQARPLLLGGAGSAVLITSRSRLSALPGAHAVAVDVMPPEQAASLLVRLSGRDDLAADDPAVVEVARLCGCLPLAISLMAGQLAHHPVWAPADLAAELAGSRSRLSLMVAEDVSVARAIEVSYRSLKIDERRLFRQLSLCPGAEIDVYAAAALDASQPEATARRLKALLEYNLLRENARGRYSFHDLVHEYARAHAQRDSSWQTRAARRRLLDYYLHCARAADRYLSRRTATGIPAVIARPPAAVPQIGSWQEARNWMDAEHLNVHDATRFAALHGWPRHAVAIPAAMSSYLRATGDWNESRELTGVGLRAAETLGLRAAKPSLLCDLGELDYYTGRFDSAAGAFAEALNLARDLGDRLGEANARLRLAAVQSARGRPDEAIPNIDLAARIYQDLRDPLGQAYAATYRGITEIYTGQFEEAERNLTLALTMYRELGIPDGEADVVGWLGSVQHETGRLESAEASLLVARDLHRRARNRLQEAGDLYYLGGVQLDAGKFEAAAQNLPLALQMYRDCGDPFGEAGVLNQMGRLEVERAGPAPSPASARERARATFAAALEIYRRVGSQNGAAEVLNNLGRLELSSGHREKARAHFDAALALAEESDSRLERARALEGVAWCLIESDERPEAVERLRLACDIYRQIKSRHLRRAERLLADLAGEEEDGQGPR